MGPLEISNKTWVYSYEILFNVLLFTILGFTLGFFIFSLNWMPTLLLSAAGVFAGAWVGTKNAKKKMLKLDLPQ
jgi:uncharacterized membrane protein YfcA